MYAFASEGNLKTDDDSFCLENEAIDSDSEIQEFLQKTKENILRFNQKSESSICSGQDTLKNASFSKELNPATKEPFNSIENFVPVLKNCLPSPVKNMENFSDKLSEHLSTAADISTKCSYDVDNQLDFDFAKFVSQLKKNLQDQDEDNHQPCNGSNLPDDTLDDSEEKSKNWMKNDLEAKSDSDCESTDESPDSLEDSSADDSEENFEKFISVIKGNLEPKYKKNPEVPLNLRYRKPLTKQRSYSLSNEGSPNESDSATKRSQSVFSGEFNLKDAESDAKQDFMRKRKFYAAQLYQFFNKTVFNNRLPNDMLLKWSGYLKSTAGKTFCRREREKGKPEQYFCRIELSTDVLIFFDRLRDTLLHEMCHAACWLINHSHDKHGPLWKTWASRCSLILPEIKVPERCHSYELSYLYTLKCVSCDFVRKRHKMCPKLDRKKCPKCYSPTVLTKA